MLYEVITLQTLDAIVCHNGEAHARALTPAGPRDFEALDTIVRQIRAGTMDDVVITSYSIHYTKLYETLAVMAKGRMPDVMTHGCSFDKIGVQSKIPPNGSCYPAKHLHMQDPVGEMVIVDQGKNLGFITVTGVGQRVENAVSISRKCKAVFGVRSSFRIPPDSISGKTGPVAKGLGFPLFKAGFQYPGCFVHSQLISLQTA